MINKIQDPYTELRKVQQMRSARGQILHINIPSYMCKILKLSKGDTVEVKLDAKNSALVIKRVD